MQAGGLVVDILKRLSPSEIAAKKDFLAPVVAKLTSDSLPEARTAGKQISAILA